MKWSFGLWKKKRLGGGISGREASFIANPPFTLLLIVGENVARRTEATRLGRTSRNRSNACIFALRVAGGSAYIFALGAAIFGRTQGEQRGHLGRAPREWCNTPKILREFFAFITIKYLLMILSVGPLSLCLTCRPGLTCRPYTARTHSSSLQLLHIH